MTDTERLVQDIADRMMSKADLGATLQAMTDLIRGEVYEVRKVLWATNILLVVIAAALWFS